MKNFISVSSRQKDVPITPKLRAELTSAVAFTLSHLGFPYPAELAVSLVDKDVIAALNREFRGKDAPTDVLSFPVLEDPSRITDADRDFSRGGCVLLGDVILCPAVIAAQAPDFSHTYEQECVYMTVHSVLHLLGYDHTAPGDGGRHEKTQDEIFALWSAEKKRKEEKSK